jgi:hypothetical protein
LQINSILLQGLRRESNAIMQMIAVHFATCAE